MNRQEAVTLCRLAKAACPQQQFDEWTPDMWSEVLGDLRFDDCKTALIACVSAKPFVSPAEVRAEVVRIRRRRLDDYGDPPIPPRALADDPIAYAEWIGAQNRRIADGEGDTVRREAAARQVGYTDHPMPEIEAVTRKVPR